MSSPISGVGTQGGYLPLAAAAGTASTGSSAPTGIPAAPTSTSTTSTTATSGTSSTNTTLENSTGEDTFLTLLVAQLKNQDPTSPMDSQAFVTELAQFNSVEQMLGLKQAVQGEATMQETSAAVAMLGKNVTYAVPATGTTPSTTASGSVASVNVDTTNNTVSLQIGTQQVPISEVTSVA